MGRGERGEEGDCVGVSVELHNENEIRRRKGTSAGSAEPTLTHRSAVLKSSMAL